MNIIFEHNILIHLSEQVVHRFEWLFGKGLKERSVWAYAPFKDLKNSIHVVGLNLEYCLAKSFHEVFQRFVLLHLNV